MACAWGPLDRPAESVATWLLVPRAVSNEPGVTSRGPAAAPTALGGLPAIEPSQYLNKDNGGAKPFGVARISERELEESVAERWGTRAGSCSCQAGSIFLVI